LPVGASERDELVGEMRAQCFSSNASRRKHPAKLVVGELIKLVDEADVDAAWILVVAPSTIIHARYLCVKLRAQLPNLKIAIGLWGATENITQTAQRVRDSGANEVVTTIADAVVQLAIIMQILHNEAEAYDNLLQEVFFHAIDRYDVSCHSSSGFNESHTVSAKHFVMISVRCCVSTWPGCRPISNGDPSGLFRGGERARSFNGHRRSSWRRETRIELGIKKLSDAFGRLRDKIV
jgi:hypothetical protein